MVQKVAVRLLVRGWAWPCDDLKTLSVNPAVNGYLFRIREGYGSERRGMGSAFNPVPKKQWDSNPHCPYGY